jgi:hypothetical protein
MSLRVGPMTASSLPTWKGAIAWHVAIVIYKVKDEQFYVIL